MWKWHLRRVLVVFEVDSCRYYCPLSSCCSVQAMAPWRRSSRGTWFGLVGCWFGLVWFGRWFDLDRLIWFETRGKVYANCTLQDLMCTELSSKGLVSVPRNVLVVDLN